MGGPVWIMRFVAGQAGHSRVQAPACTDNFQIATFEFAGHAWHSCEQAFQAAKFEPGSHAWANVAFATPSADESSGAFGFFESRHFVS